MLKLVSQSMRNIKEALSLKRFILRSETLRLYKNYMKIGRLIEELNKDSGSAKDLRQEWDNWVRCEFRLRKDVDDELTIQTILAHGTRQLNELERSVRIANS